MTRSTRTPLWVACGAALFALLLLAGAALAQEDEGLGLLFGDGRLVITGAGFKPGERVTVSVRLGDRVTRTFTAMADGGGVSDWIRAWRSSRSRASRSMRAATGGPAWPRSPASHRSLRRRRGSTRPGSSLASSRTPEVLTQQASGSSH
jgi:hypothetical protein